MKNYNEIKAGIIEKSKIEIEGKIKNLEVEEKFDMFLNNDRKISFFHAKNETHVKFENSNITELLEIYKKSNVLNLEIEQKSCTSFYVKKENSENLEIAPILIQFEKMVEYKQKTNIEFKIKIDDIIFRLNFEVSENIGEIDYIKENYRGGYTIKNVRFFPNDKLKNFKKIQWAAGSDKYINSFTLYFDKNTNIIELLENLI